MAALIVPIKTEISDIITRIPEAEPLPVCAPEFLPLQNFKLYPPTSYRPIYPVALIIL
jgi:hypothetical protein